jgi:branched-chain amino acid transport system permease protein
MGGIYALIAIGLNLQYGLMRVLNIGHGELLMLGAYLTYTLYTTLGLNPIISLFFSGPVLFLVGLLIHKLLFRRLIQGSMSLELLEMNSLLISFGLLFIIQNVALIIWTGDIRGYSYLNQPISLLGGVFPANRIIAFSIAIIFSVGFYLFLRFSLYGKVVRAVMQDKIGSQLIGVRIFNVHSVCFGLGVAMAGITGSLLSMIFEISPSMGLPYTVEGLIVIILGGLGNILGSLIGGLIIGLVENFGAYLTSPDLQMLISYATFIAILLIRPKGILGR